MAKSSSLLDPFGLWRGLAAKLEESAKDLADKGVNSDEFTQGVHKLMGAALLARKLNRAVAQRLLEMLNVPTRADVEALGAQLRTVDDRLIDITAALHRVGATSSSGAVLPSPPRTRKPPAEAAPAEATPALAAAPPVAAAPVAAPRVAAAARKKPAGARRARGTP